MVKSQKGNLELEIVFCSCQQVNDIKQEIESVIREERRKKGIQFHISRLDIKGNKLIFFLKGEKIQKQRKTSIRDFLKRRTRWIPGKYSLVRCIPEQADMREELEKARKQLERRFGGKYKVSVLLPTIETKKGGILVILLGKLIK